MINGIEELLGEIDKFKDSVQDTSELSKALHNSAEEIMKNTEKVDGFKEEVRGIVDNSKSEIISKLEEIDHLQQRAYDEESKKTEEIVQLIEKLDSEFSAKISLLKSTINKKISLLFGVSAICAVTAIVVLIMLLIK